MRHVQGVMSHASRSHVTHMNGRRGEAAVAGSVVARATVCARAGRREERVKARQEGEG